MLLSAAVVPKTDCLSTHVLCLCGGRGVVDLCSRQQPPSRLFSTAASLPCDSARPGTIEPFAAPPVVSMLLLLKRFLDGLYLAFHLGSFLFLCGFSSPSSVSEFLRADLIHSTPLLL